MSVFSIEDCPNCGLKTKRAFHQGDYVFKDGSECAKCKHITRISMIFGESMKPQ